MRLIASRIVQLCSTGTHDGKFDKELPGGDGREPMGRRFSVKNLTPSAKSSARNLTPTVKELPLSPAGPDNFFVESALERKVVSVRRPQKPCLYHLLVHPHNEGAMELVEELRAACPSPVLVTSDLHELHLCEHFLLYLTSATWTSGAASTTLAAGVRQAMRSGTHVLLAHESLCIKHNLTTGREHRAVEFEQLFACEHGATPTSLLKRGLYREIAVALKDGAWRPASVRLLLHALAKWQYRFPAAASMMTGSLVQDDDEWGSLNTMHKSQFNVLSVFTGRSSARRNSSMDTTASSNRRTEENSANRSPIRLSLRRANASLRSPWRRGSGSEQRCGSEQCVASEECNTKRRSSTPGSLERGRSDESLSNEHNDSSAQRRRSAPSSTPGPTVQTAMPMLISASAEHDEEAAGAMAPVPVGVPGGAAQCNAAYGTSVIHSSGGADNEDRVGGDRSEDAGADLGELSLLM